MASGPIIVYDEADAPGLGVARYFCGNSCYCDGSYRNGVCYRKCCRGWNLDPRDRTSGIQKANDHTVYFVASRCPPITFDHLKGRKITLWHSWSDGPECKALPGGKLAVGGGTTSGMRAINIGYLLGYRKFVLYGYDSCNDAEGKKRFTGEMTGPTLDVYVGAEKRKFTCNAAMAQQANEFQMLYAVMPDITVEAKGPGLIAAIIDERKRLKFVA